MADVPVPFIVVALPRSRTAWMSQWLSYGPWVCGHDESRHWRGLEDARSWFMQPFVGLVDTELVHWWRLLDRFVPGARVVTVRRPVVEVVESLVRLGLGEGPHIMQLIRRMDRKLDQIEARVPGVMRVEFGDLGREQTCRAMWEYCLGTPFDVNWWDGWRKTNVQINVSARIRYSFAHLPQLVKLRDLAKHQVLADLHAQHERAPYGALTIQEEPWETSFGDAQHLLEEHCVDVGEASDEWTKHNLPLFAKMDEMGLLQIMTARANGSLGTDHP